MRSNFDKVISVPIECDDVNKTVAQLPRHPEDAEIVAVQLKRRLQLKNSHLQEFIRPQTVIKALQTLKEKCSNPFYQDIEINEGFLNKPVIETDQIEVESASQILEQELDEECEGDEQNDGREVESIMEPEAKSGTVEDEESDDEYDTRLKSVKNFQSKQENNTCLLPRDMANQIVMNTGKSTIKKATENESIQIAPGKLFFFSHHYLYNIMIYS